MVHLLADRSVCTGCMEGQGRNCRCRAQARSDEAPFRAASAVPIHLSTWRKTRRVSLHRRLAQAIGRLLQA